ncbi:hypothetical protein ACE1AT_14345 [Pelatocladus sp. BLCC-F211]|uniref:hypothetical protein n=1 Tax=Pelatocladus sp. BLCC-F211 TaxID=3342752 RepID=UPI0035BB0688
MTTDTELLQALARQEELLKSLLAALSKPKLGLHNDTGICKIYCNRQHNNCLWYTLTNGEPVPVNATALTGYLKELKFEQTSRRGKPCHKLSTTIAADRLYLLESGHDTHFSKALLSAIASLTHEQLIQPITISPAPGDDESVLFCRVWIGSYYIKAPYTEDTDWKQTAKTAIAAVKAIQTSS